ncbi:MAG: hypothetical protein MI784_02680 [Cytophagales bacterium]|nr:hypothetical protein [Cytophagales bacterium]
MLKKLISVTASTLLGFAVIQTLEVISAAIAPDHSPVSGSGMRLLPFLLITLIWGLGAMAAEVVIRLILNFKTSVLSFLPFLIICLFLFLHFFALQVPWFYYIISFIALLAFHFSGKKIKIRL